MVGNGGKAQSRFEERGSGEGGARYIGAVALRSGLAKGDRRPSAWNGDALRDGEALIGVNCSCGKYGRSINVSAIHTRRV